MLSTRYSPKETETKWYDYWMEKNYFHSEPDDREAYSIVIPPPNVTGLLHMGHMLDNTIQDVLIRKARLDGKNACWVPGTDHASIATEAKVVKMLRERGIKKSDLSREEFMAYAYEWKDKYGGMILDQLKRLGASCDWDRTRFTMEPKMYDLVIWVFVDLYKKGKIYRGLRMTNWDPVAQTVLSNEEVIHKEEQSKLYFIKYQVEGTLDEWVTIATVRPETILGDTAIAINPKDERYSHLKGKKAVVPLIGRTIPIIEDSYVDIEFGTGALKITPAHDQNDHQIGEKHGLEVIDVLNADGTMSKSAKMYIGEDRFKARKLILKDLKAAGHFVKEEDYTNNVGRSERTNAVVEPRLTEQWFMEMKDFAKTALDAVESDEVTFYPSHFWNMYHNWLNEDKVRDWCISRQLWWGQRIPAWYYQGEVFVAENGEDALQQAQEKLADPKITLTDLTQDEDVVDTWFSSWLWPISVFDGFEHQKDLAYYYPTNVCVTGWDIMFFWVARMIMAGYEWSEDLLGSEFINKKGRQPFNDVFFHGMVRDNKKRKMSKSLGNSPDALALIDRYGADGVRFGMLSSAVAGNDIIFDSPFDPETKEIINESKLCDQGSKFCNKMWNALRLVSGWEIDQAASPGTVETLAAEWMESRLQEVLHQIEQNFVEYKLSETLKQLYKLIWDDFCSWYLEMIKPAFGQKANKDTYERTLVIFEELMSILHPFMPFITEEIWQQLRDRLEGEDCVVSEYPKTKEFNQELVERVGEAKTLISNIRDLRNVKGLGTKIKLDLFAQASANVSSLFEKSGLKEMIIKIANLNDVQSVETEPENSVSIVMGTDKYYVQLEESINVEEERARLIKDLDYYKGFVKSILKKLDNERFVNNAPAAVVDMERKKLADGETRIKNLKEALDKVAD